MAKYGLLLCGDGSNNEVTFEALPPDYFKSVGLPERRIELEVRTRIAMHLWIEEHGWLGLFKHALKHGVLRVDAGQDPLEGLIGSNSKPVHAAVAERVLPPPWAAGVARVRLAKKPLFLTFDDAQRAAIDEESQSSWRRWFGANWKARSCLANALHRKHHWGFQIGACVYDPEEQECPEADEHFRRCLGTTAPPNDDESQGDDASQDGDDPELHEELDDEEKRLATEALDAAEVPRDSFLRRATKAFASAVPRLCSSAAGDVVSDSEASRDAAEAASGSEDDDRFKSCFDLMREGSLAAKKTPRGQRPCGDCLSAFQRGRVTCRTCKNMERRPVPGSRRGTRDRTVPGSTPEFVGVRSCNEVMDVETGLRTDGGMTCQCCFDAVYLDEGYRGRHATIGGEPYSQCYRKEQSRKDSFLVSRLKQKLEKLRRQRAVGNIE